MLLINVFPILSFDFGKEDSYTKGKKYTIYLISNKIIWKGSQSAEYQVNLTKAIVLSFKTYANMTRIASILHW